MLKLPKQRPMMTLKEIQNEYQNSVLCKTTREAKESGEWFKNSYTD